ncbi:MAG: hypothetical protein EON54_08635 [Alcaligenaceae bacterium]|nr:MAG: hypothetical protein EON54_08635 [Alcaligenaceae bacterium]
MKAPIGYLPNPHAALSVVRVRIVGEGKLAKAVSESYRVIGFQIDGEKATPITPLGLLVMDANYIYALVDKDDKSHTDLKTRVVHKDYKDWIAPLWAEFDLPAVTTAATAEVTERKSSGPQPWRDPVIGR